MEQVCTERSCFDQYVRVLGSMWGRCGVVLDPSPVERPFLGMRSTASVRIPLRTEVRLRLALPPAGGVQIPGGIPPQRAGSRDAHRGAESHRRSFRASGVDLAEAGRHLGARVRCPARQGALGGFR